jgi:hypothetical protein
MRNFIPSLTSEYYKSRKTLNFGATILLPVILCTIVCLGFFAMADKFEKMDGKAIWGFFSGAILGVMGNLLLPLLVIFLANSVNSQEHKADTWKTLFSLPISKWTIYAAKYFYILMLLFISILLFALFTIGYGNLLGAIRPNLKFHDYQMKGLLLASYFKLFLSCLGILSIQFLLSLIWSDFLKPMGIGFLLFIIGVVVNSVNWHYAFLMPYAHPAISIKTMVTNPSVRSDVPINIFTSEILMSIIVSTVVFFAGYYVVKRTRIT